jgi:phosphopantothenoylcysteine decarboxylase/phosphopantothenate--cysteine ligase
MNDNMYENAVTQENIASLKERGFIFVGPGFGRLASGKTGHGRLAELDELVGTIKHVLGQSGDMAGKSVVVTAGGTREPLDPVRFVGNRSSGKMGYAVAEAARDRGARVVLVTCPTAHRPPVGMEIVPVRTALEMRDAVWGACEDADVLIMTAAVGDYRPVSVAEQKIKKAKSETLTIELVRNPDILKGAKGKGRLIKIGFAAETEKLLEHAREELEEKGVDLVAANDVTAADSGFATDTNRVVFLDRQGGTETLPLMLKSQVAERLMDRITAILAKRT